MWGDNLANRGTAGMSHRKIAVVSGLILLLIGLMMAGNYGLSTDEPIQAAYGRTTLWFYLGLQPDQFGPANLPYYGPFFSAMTEAVSLPLGYIHPSWTIIDARHFIYYLSFLLAVWAVFDISGRLVRPLYAGASAALFALQPLLFGHAFINPKDIPFMAFFSATVAVGIRGVERVVTHRELHEATAVRPSEHAIRRPIQFSVSRWNALSKGGKGLLVASLALFLIGTLELFWTKVLLKFGLSLIESAYEGEAPEFVMSVFRTLAVEQDTVSLQAYLSKARELYGVPRRLGMVLLLPLLSVATATFLGWKRIQDVLKPWLTLAAAGVLLGVTTSIRIAGPFAGILVSLYLLSRSRAKLPPLFVLWCSASVASYLTWPALWPDPVEHLIASLEVMGSFSHGSLELFMGRLIPANEIPWRFVPYLMAIQFTLPVMILALLGAVTSVVNRSGQRARPVRLLLIAIGWFVVPILVQLMTDTAIYGNFRVLFFSIPPLFLFAAVGMERLLSPIGSFLVTAVAIAVFLLPGVVGIVRLHPYEYIYYNTLAGGTAQASERFETDYWCTSLREAMEHVNTIAPEGASVAVHRVSGLAKPFARADLRVFAVEEEEEVHSEEPYYVLVCPRSDFDRTFLPDAPVIWQVRQAGTELTVVKQPTP